MKTIGLGIILLFPFLAVAANLRRVTVMPTSATAASSIDSREFKKNKPKKKDTCPDADPGVICTSIYDPVDCNGCTYSNGCLAGAAGFDVSNCAKRDPIGPP